MFLVNTIYYKASYVLTTSYVLANALEKVDEISVNNPYWQTGNWGAVCWMTEHRFAQWWRGGAKSQARICLITKAILWPSIWT